MKTQVKIYRGIKVKFLGPTNYRGARICFTDERCRQRKVIDYSYAGGDMLDQAINYLTGNGFKVIGVCELRNYYIINCDSWESEL